MKILYSHRTKSADGQYVHIRALTDALIARGHELRIVGPEGVSERAERALDADPGTEEKTRSRFRVPKPLYEAAEFGYSVPAMQRLGRVARDFGPDVLYERYNLFFHSGLWIARQRRMPFILEVNAPLAEERRRHSGLALEPLAEHSERTLWRAADAVLPVTQVLADRIAAKGVDPARIHVIQNGVDTDFLMPLDPRPIRERYNLAGKTVLGFTGFVRDWHGVDRVLSVMAEQDDPSLHLLLVGDGPARADLEAKAAKLGIQGRLTVTGIVQREAVPAHVAAFDIALQPAAVDYASPLKLFEYMAAGKAILAPARPNIMEVLSDGADARLFDPDAPNGFERALIDLIEVPEIRDRLGIAARESLQRRNFTWAGNAARVETIIDRLRRNT